MKRLLLFLSLITLSSFKDTYIDNFYEAVEKAYNEYRVVEEYANVSYTIKVIQGVMSEQIYYGVCFYNEMPKEYKLRIVINDKTYRLQPNNRNDEYIIALNLGKATSFSLVVYDKHDRIQSLGTQRLSNIGIITTEDFNLKTDKISGEGAGVRLVKPVLLGTFFSPVVILIIILFTILIFCSIIILVFYKKRKGMFSDVEKKRNVFDFKKFIVSVEQSLYEEGNSFEEAEVIDITPNENETSPNNINYIPHYSWARDEEETSNFNIKKHLLDKGYIYDYKIIDEEEKNKIMLELMYLKEQKLITKDDYLNEISELWKESKQIN